MKQKQLTGRQQDVLHFIEKYIERNGYPPTCADIATAFGFSTRGAYEHLAVLQRKGHIRKMAGKPRTVCLVKPERRVYRLRAPMPAYGLQEGDCVVVQRVAPGTQPNPGQCVVWEGGTVVGVVVSFTRQI